MLRRLALLADLHGVLHARRAAACAGGASEPATGLEAVVQHAEAQRDADSRPSVPPDRMPTLLAADQYHATHKHKVAIFRSDGSVAVSERTGSELNVAVRDMPMFHSARHGANHAALTLRDGAILLRTELVRAILKRDCLVLFECRRPGLSERVGLTVLHSLAPRRGTRGVPFELRMLEALLDETVVYLEDKQRQLRMLSRAVQADISQRVSSADIRRMLPLQKAVTALQYDVAETSAAIREVADNDKRLALLCLSEDQNLAASAASGSRWSKHMATAQRLLVAIERRIRSLDSDLRELSEHLDSTREVWHMQLDALRNRIIRLNLHLEFASIALMAAITPATFFGMNLVSGVEERTGLFWSVAAGSASAAVVIYTGLFAYHSIAPMGIARRRLSDMTALQDLLSYNQDEVGDVISALRRHQQRTGRAISRDTFAALVRSALGGPARKADEANVPNGHTLTDDKIDVLYRVLDRDHDGTLDVAELEHAHSRAVSASADSRGYMELHPPPLRAGLLQDAAAGAPGALADVAAAGGRHP